MNKKLLRDIITGNFQRNNPLPDVNFKEYVLEHFEFSKCDNCNCAIRDCSLCGVSSFDYSKNGESIC